MTERKYPRVRSAVGSESRTKQSFRTECNINKIMEKHQRTGLINHLSTKSPLYGDFSEMNDYHTSYNRVLDAQKEFLTLPSRLRKRFDNDAGKLMNFLHDPKNLDEAIKLGLLKNVDSKATPSLSQMISEASEGKDKPKKNDAKKGQNDGESN
jgi:phage internal scaffolding protein